MYCIYCGKKNPDDAIFCGSCGERTVVPVYRDKTKSTAPDVKKDRTRSSTIPTIRSISENNTFSRSDYINYLPIVIAILFIVVVIIKLINGIKLDSLTFWTRYAGYALVIVGFFRKKNPLSFVGFALIAAGHGVVAYLYAQGDYGIKDFYYDEMFHNIVYCSSFVLIALATILSGIISRFFSLPAILIRFLYRLILLTNGSSFSKSAVVDIIEILAFAAICVMNWKKKAYNTKT